MMTDIERRALLGDRKAQEECTRNEIVRPCPFCGGPVTVKSQKVQYGLSGTIISCKKCLVQLYSSDERAVPTHDGVRNTPIEKHKEIGISRWNTRQIPPIGRCGECKHRSKHDPTVCNHPVTGIFDMLTPEDFCSYFEPKDGEEDVEI